jgi:hypothetical protein
VNVPGATPAASPQTRFSIDGFWWWDGAEWKPAVSPDRLWQWNGLTWIARNAGTVAGSSASQGVVITIAVFAGVLVLVTMLTLVVLLTMGGQIGNVFSNVVAALTGT